MEGYNYSIGIYKLNKVITFIRNFKIKINHINKGYTPIDWYIDFKSGYIFNPIYWGTKNRYLKSIGKKRGVDIKIPWTFGSMHHLVRISILAVFDTRYKEKAIIEFRDEIIDFMLANPYNKTVQWSSTLSVSIRVVNLLISYDIIRQLDTRNILSKKFKTEFYNFIVKHGEYIVKNLEYIKHHENYNHYLGNIVGLLFVSAYLESSKLTDAWLVFSTQELIDQSNKQFNNDGSNFEGSTSYHRLSTEFVVYSMALILGLLKTNRINSYSNYDNKLLTRLKSPKNQKYSINNKSFFPQLLIDKVFLAGIFTKDIMNQKNEISQIGDNDSERVLNISPIGQIISYSKALKKYYNLPIYSEDKYYFDENILNHTSLLSAVSGLINYNSDLNNYSKKLLLENSLVRTLCKNHLLEPSKFNKFNDKTITILNIDNINFPYKNTTKFKSIVNGINNNLKFINYPDFGICIFKSNILYLCIVVDTSRKLKIPSHVHNDKLSFELMIDGISITKDPGTYLYTPFEDIRNSFRSTSAHNTITVNNLEQNNFIETFNIYNYARGYIIDYNENYIKLYESYKDIHHVREFVILDNEIIIYDYCNKKFKINFNNTYSNGYGKLLKRL